MAPKQCPECARFLRNDLVASLVDGDQPCPRCEAPLQASMFDLSTLPAPRTPRAAAPLSVPSPVVEATPDEEPSAEDDREPSPVEESSVAPSPDPEPSPAAEPSPDPEPAPAPAPEPVEIAGTPDDPLTGWDVGGYVPRTMDVLQAEDQTPALTAGGAVTGALLGWLSLGRTRGRGAVLGTVVGAVTGVVVARMTAPRD